MHQYTFTEELKIGDKVSIIFYKGNGDSDVIFRDVIETVKKGDTLQLNHMAGVQHQSLDEDERSVLSVLSTGNVETNPYFGPGNTNDVTLARPVTWCRQTEDKIINEFHQERIENCMNLLSIQVLISLKTLVLVPLLYMLIH